MSVGCVGCCVRLLCGVLCQIVARKCFSYGAQSSIFANKFLYGLVCFIVFAVSSVRAVVRNPCLDISNIWCQKLLFFHFIFYYFYFFKLCCCFLLFYYYFAYGFGLLPPRGKRCTPTTSSMTEIE